jgi:hypothetical protein
VGKLACLRAQSTAAAGSSKAASRQIILLPDLEPFTLYTFFYLHITGLSFFLYLS